MQILAFFIKNKSIALLLAGIILLTVIVLIDRPRKSSPPPITAQKKTLPPNRGLITGKPQKESADPEQRLIERVESRFPLSPDDFSAKRQILSLLPLGKQTGIVYQSNDFIVEYVESADLFQVEIKTTNTLKAKTDAVSWFQSNGVSSEAICTLPISFYLNYEIKSTIGEAAETFNPLPPGC